MEKFPSIPTDTALLFESTAVPMLWKSTVVWLQNVKSFRWPPLVSCNPSIVSFPDDEKFAYAFGPEVGLSQFEKWIFRDPIWEKAEIKNCNFDRKKSTSLVIKKIRKLQGIWARLLCFSPYSLFRWLLVYYFKFVIGNSLVHRLQSPQF
jgi:hypothetical protein